MRMSCVGQDLQPLSYNVHDDDDDDDDDDVLLCEYWKRTSDEYVVTCLKVLPRYSTGEMQVSLCYRRLFPLESVLATLLCLNVL
jgi:hypothetical protein